MKGSLAATALAVGMGMLDQSNPMRQVFSRGHGWTSGFRNITVEREARMPKPKFSRGGQRKLIRKAPRYNKAK